MSDLEIKITTDPAEIEEAQRLRYQVFNLEMKKGLKGSHDRGLDVDEFDRFCDHLIVRDGKSQEVIGTYRLLLGDRASNAIGFYSEREFDLRQIKRLDGELLELGRSCARKDFRDRALIPLMWEAIAHYVKSNGVRYLFGCGSLYTTDAGEVSKAFALLKQKYYAADAFRVQPLAPCRFEGLMEDLRIAGEDSVFVELPSLIKGYLRLGAVVCGPPALDCEFGTADFFILMDMQKLNSSYLGRLGLSRVKAPHALS